MANDINLDYYSLEEMAKRLYPGEPVFVLRAADLESTPQITSYGAKMVQDPNADQEQFNKGVAALEMARLFCQWQQRNPDKVKLPDLPTQ